LLQKYQRGSGRKAEEELMDRETALKAIQENVKNENLIKHMLIK
jgi:predicted hydrolase (HD superfamily)